MMKHVILKEMHDLLTVLSTNLLIFPSICLGQVLLDNNYRQNSNISRALGGNKLVVGAATTTFSFST